MNKYDKKHLSNLNTYQQRIADIFASAARDAANLSALIGYLGDKPLSWSDYPLAEAQVNKIIEQLNSDLRIAIVNGVRSEWTLSNNKNNELCQQVFGSLSHSLPEQVARRYYSTNGDALDAFIQRKNSVTGLSLSDNVWNYTNQFKNEIEMALDLGIRSGRSADEMSRDVRDFLKYPDKLFQRVRDEHGMLHLSKRASLFRPGQGVYRSSYLNARRLTATETNIAYRTADHLRWQQLDFVVGIRIVLSNNHTCLGSDGKPHPFEDICDQLSAPYGSTYTSGQGCYPKDFKFVGWHPHCRCHAESILKTDEEIAEDNRRILNGEDVSEGSVNEVKDLPSNFTEWLKENKERAKGWESMPYFVRDNKKYTNGFKVNLYDQDERKFTRARKTADAMFTAVRNLSVKYPEIPNTELAAIYHFTRGDVSAFRKLNNQLRKGNVDEFNKAFSTLLDRGLDKLDPITATTYRTIRLNKTRLAEWLKMAANQSETVFQGFTSSSLDRAIVENFALNHTGRKKNERDVILKIKGKSGRSIENLSQFGTMDNGTINQREVLFRKGSKFRVLSVERLTTGAFEYEFVLEEV